MVKPTQHDILECIYDALRELNGQFPPEQRLAAVPETALQGGASRLDSLGLINLLVLIEDGLETRVGRRVALLDERHMAAETGPFRTVQTLAVHIGAALDG